MMEDPRNITPCTHLLFIAKNIERMGDHATNIAETIKFVVAGKRFAGERLQSRTPVASLVERGDQVGGKADEGGQ
jgi:phosphate transport system protein